MDEDRIMEILWKNGQVSQSQRSIRKTTPSDLGEDAIPADESTRHQGRPQSLFVQEDEMASWLQYPLHGTAFPSDFCSDFLYGVSAAETMTTAVPTAITNASAITSALVGPRPPFPPQLRIDNFAHFRRFDESGPSSSNRAVKESTVVDSGVTLAVPPQLTVSDIRETSARVTVTVAASVSVPAASLTGVDSEAPACDVSVTSGGSTESVEPPAERAVPIALPEDRKRKGQEPDSDGGDCRSEDDELGDAKKRLRCSSTSTRRSRAAEVHNLSERKRRDRINEKMKTLQELIPNCNKMADKASMLDDAIEYLKSLQLQLQMISMGGCSSMVPTMMFPPLAPQQQQQQQQLHQHHQQQQLQQHHQQQQLQQQQHYIIPQQHIGGMGIGMGINRPMMMMMVPFPNNNVLTAAAGSVGVAHHLLTPRFPMQPPMFHNMQQQQQQQQQQQNVAAASGGVAGANPASSGIQFPQPGAGGGSYHDPTMLSSSSNLALNPNMGLADPLYQHHQYLSSLHNLQIPPHPPNQELQQGQQGTSKAKAGENLEHQPKG